MKIIDSKSRMPVIAFGDHERSRVKDKRVSDNQYFISREDRIQDLIRRTVDEDRSRHSLFEKLPIESEWYQQRRLDSAAAEY